MQEQAARQPDEIAYVFLRNGEDQAESVTYRQLEAAARIRAAALRSSGLTGGRVLLMYPAGLEFVRALLGCMRGQVVAAPVQVPARREHLRKIRRISEDAGTSVVLTTTGVKADVEGRFTGAPEMAGLTLVPTDDAQPSGIAAEPGTAPVAGDIALLQYTSGSTGEPKGVMIRHANFLSNAVQTEQQRPLGSGGRMVSWLPNFHDMGMMFGVVLPLYAGVPSYLMAPAAFIRRPARWLEAIARFGATHSVAPSFAYEMCAQAARRGDMTEVGDLSRWRFAGNGAEPVRHTAIEAFCAAFEPHGFGRHAMCPGYGLAENTLTATATPDGHRPTIAWLSAQALRAGRVEPAVPRSPGASAVVSCGTPVPGTSVMIADPVTRQPVGEGRVGEIWLAGPSVAAGYWRRPHDSERVFHARPAHDQDSHVPPQTHHQPSGYLRTGDLGYFMAGELYVTGRLKDVIVRQGQNHYPQDIEFSAERAVSGLHPNCAAAFSLDDGWHERLIVVVEADGRVLRETGPSGVCDKVRRIVHAAHRLPVHEVVVVRRGALPKTSSGKIQRQACRQAYLDGHLHSLVPRPDNMTPHSSPQEAEG
ncbi:fatty acyl-AMP ligase [Streptomyces sp. TRM 70351]|uniref:fatty acyl-AMP ligase n=1 Tax=Streptomyces sp. TRM 70351 TaxID=3116552 RepID=UPI002E7B0B80|nr:fatty acyl-AMP ligase [Streptomyces sp. TRM 70351]MEE1928862.1 fatty acyl-AMP ligase [Streptomyces sp. TRM 70351]